MVYGKQDRLSAKRCWNEFYPDSRLDELNVPVTRFYDHSAPNYRKYSTSLNP